LIANGSAHANRDTSFAGGLIDLECGSLYVGLTGSLNEVNPMAENPSDPLDTFEVELQYTADWPASICRCS
jgi:hypothetical protein